MAARFVVGNPALAPLFAAVGAGICGATLFGVYVLRSNPEVVVARRSNPEPWNKVAQDQNKKLLFGNKDFWTGRVGMPDPRAAFMSASETTGAAVSSAKAKVKEVKERAAAASKAKE